MQLYYTIRILKSISYFCSAQFLWFSYLCKLIYSIQLPSASLQLAVCCRRIHRKKACLHPVGYRSTDNKNTPLHVNMQGASLLSDICSADAVFIKLYLARYHSNSSLQSCCMMFFVGFDGRYQGVLSDFYLLRRFTGDCIVILMSHGT